MFAASKTDAVSGAAPDGQFNYVAMLLHGDGTNGAQNNTFLDSSSNAFSITRSGNTTQGSFSPYGSNWSNNFNGSTGYLTAADNTALNFGTGDFTIEGWFYTVNNCGASFITKGVGGTSGYGLGIGSSGSNYSLYITSLGQVIISSSSVVFNAWTHVAATRSGSTVRLFVNGVVEGTYTSSADLSNTEVQKIGLSRDGGSFFNGYISNVRIVKGTAVYTSAFTPSTAPLTAITNTSLLTCQSNTFIDNSSNAFSLTIGGAPSVQRFNPFGASAAYSTSVVGGSLYSDGSGELQLPTNAALAPQTSDFCLECWIYSTQAFTTSYSGIYVGDATLGIFIGQLASGSFGVRQRSNADLLSRTPPAPNQWVNIAVTRSGTSLRMFYNGIQQGATVTDSTVFLSGATSILSTTFPFYGHISNLRFVKGSAVYTSNFTPSTSPVTAITNTQLLTNFTNGAIFDNAMMNDLETVGNAQISTSVKKYGTGSLLFDGNDLLLAPNTPNINFGSGDFTIEAWVYRTSESGTNNNIFQKGITTSSNFQLNFSINSSNQLFSFYSTDGSSVTAIGTTSTTIPQTTWTHVAVSRSGNTWRYFINGTLETTTTAAVTLFTGSGLVSVGANPEANSGFYGYIDDLRVTKGYARYTATFTPPTAALSDTGPY